MSAVLFAVDLLYFPKMSGEIKVVKTVTLVPFKCASCDKHLKAGAPVRVKYGIKFCAKCVPESEVEAQPG